MDLNVIYLDMAGSDIVYLNLLKLDINQLNIIFWTRDLTVVAQNIIGLRDELAHVLPSQTKKHGQDHLHFSLLLPED